MGKHEAFGGRVVFYTRPASLRVTLDYNRLNKLVESIGHEAKEGAGMLADMVYCIVSTEQIEFCFQGTETPLLTDFRAMWEDLRPYTVESATRALDWLLDGALDIHEEWKKAANNSNALWIDPVDAPLEKLDPALQVEAADSESFLASSAPKGNKRTSPS